jgi:hypothetical protein
MIKYFVPDNIYQDRISICKDCIFYFKPTGTCKDCGCFMKIKARLAPMECSQKKWEKTTEIEAPDDLPQEIIDEVLDVWQYIKRGKAKNVEQKKRMIEIYNTIYGSNYSVRTNCGSCLQACFDGINKLYKKYKQ